MILHSVITSRSNPTVKWAASLLDKKGRDAASSFIAEGEKLSFEAIESGLDVTHIFITERKYDVLMPRINELSGVGKLNETEVYVLSESAFEKISTEKAPQGIITVIKHLDFFEKLDIIYKEEFFQRAEERMIILSSVRDPGNLGSVIRSSVAFGVDRIILSADSADIYNPKTVRSSMSSIFRVKVSIVSDLAGTINEMKSAGRRVFAAELSEKALSLDSLQLLPTDVVVIGNEGHGISGEISNACSNSLYIPISHKTESLNASVAAAIFMWEQNK